MQGCTSLFAQEGSESRLRPIVTTSDAVRMPAQVGVRLRMRYGERPEPGETQNMTDTPGAVPCCRPSGKSCVILVDKSARFGIILAGGRALRGRPILSIEGG